MLKQAYYLKPIYNNQKSFYNKAVVFFENGYTFLKSYDTVVACVDTDSNFYRLWDGYSVTTMKHINDFIYQMNIDGGGKKWWESLPVENEMNFYKKVA